MIRSLLLALTLLIAAAVPARADDDVKADDQVVINIAREAWVSTQTARVVVGVEASVTGSSAGSARANMLEAVKDIAEVDWRLTNFRRSQDQTGMERWSAEFEARLPENKLSGLSETAKKVSKAGMQITVRGIDFSPTLAETQAALSDLRVQLYKEAAAQLEKLNAALPERSYRIATISFGETTPAAAPMAFQARKMMAMGVANEMAESAAQPMERAEKVTVSANIVFAALAPTTPSAK